MKTIENSIKYFLHFMISMESTSDQTIQVLYLNEGFSRKNKIMLLISCESFFTKIETFFDIQFFARTSRVTSHLKSEI